MSAVCPEQALDRWQRGLGKLEEQRVRAQSATNLPLARLGLQDEL